MRQLAFTLRRVAPLGLLGAVLAAVPAVAAGTQFSLADNGSVPSRLGAELITQALVAQGFTVTRVTYATPGEADAALRAGTVEGYVTDTATLLERTLGQPKERREAALPGVIVAQLAARGYQILGMTPSDDAAVVVCTPKAVRVQKLGGLVRLPQRAPSLTYAASPDHVIRADGLASLRSSFRRVIVRSGFGRFDVIAAKRAHCVHSTGAEPRNARLGLVTLRDTTRRLAGTPRHNVTVVTAAYVASAPPTFAATVERVAATVTTPALARLRGTVELDGQDLAAVARAHLVAAGIVT